MRARISRLGVSFLRPAILSGLLLSGLACQTVPYVAGKPIDDEVIEQSLRESIAIQYPTQFRSIHRALLTVRKRQFNLDGYLRVDRSEGFRLLVTSGFGTTMFELTKTTDGEVELLQTNDVLDQNILLSGPTRDVLALYFRQPSPSAQLTAPTPDTWALVDSLGKNIVEEYLFDRTSKRLRRYILLEGGKVQYMIMYDYLASGGGSGYSYPIRIRLSSEKPKYEIEMHIVEFKPDSFDAKVLLGGAQRD